MIEKLVHYTVWYSGNKKLHKFLWVHTNVDPHNHFDNVLFLHYFI